MSLKPKISNFKEKVIIMIMIISVLVGIYIALSSCLNMEDSEWLNNRKEACIMQTEKLAADADKNGVVNSTDCTKILRYLKGYENL